MSTPRTVRLAIIGSGPAGWTAAIYAARASLNPVIVAGLQPGGQLTITTDVENYPGFAETIQGPWLMEQMQAQAEHVGAEVMHDIVTKADLSQRPFRLTLDSGAELLAETVIISTGAQAKWLPGERAEIPGLRRLGLRHLRRLLLSRQGRPRRRRRQHRRRRGAVPDQFRVQGHRRPPPQRVPLREDPAGPPVRQSEDRSHLGSRDR